MRKTIFSGIEISISDIQLTQEEYEVFREKVLLPMSAFFGGKTIDVNLKGKLEPQ